MLASLKVLGKRTVIFLNCSQTQSSVAVGLVSVLQNHSHRVRVVSSLDQGYYMAKEK